MSYEHDSMHGLSGAMHVPDLPPRSRARRANAQPLGIERICILDVEPELRNGLDPAALPAQREASGALTWTLPRGRFSCAAEMFDSSGGLGLLIVEGMIIRHVFAGDMETVELVGSGDVLRPSVEMDVQTAPCSPSHQHWTVLRRTRVAILDRSFALAVSPWPEIAANIGDRLAMRVGWMALATAIRSVRRVDRRLLAMLWSYADRWGRVTPDGVVLELELTHGQLAGLVGARRPSVTTALSALEHNGEIERRHDRSWLLRGERPRASGSAASVQQPQQPREREQQKTEGDHQRQHLGGRDRRGRQQLKHGSSLAS